MDLVKSSCFFGQGLGTIQRNFYSDITGSLKKKEFWFFVLVHFYENSTESLADITGSLWKTIFVFSTLAETYIAYFNMKMEDWLSCVTISLNTGMSVCRIPKSK